MQYINPVEILGFQKDRVVKIDAASIKRAKRRLFADIELSDKGVYVYKGIQLTKSQCEQAVDQLESPELVAYYVHLASNSKLNDFLATGDTQIFSSFKQEGVYADRHFIRFINPFFAHQVSGSLSKAFSDGNVDELKTMLNVYRTLFYDTNEGIAYKGLTAKIKQQIVKIKEITADIKKGDSVYVINYKELVALTKSLLPTHLINTLPKYFDSAINDIASTLNQLLLPIFNKGIDYEVSMKLIEQVVSLRISSVHKPTYEKNYRIIKARYLETKEKEKNAPILKAWASILSQIQSIHNKLEQNEITTKSALGRLDATLWIDDETHYLPVLEKRITGLDVAVENRFFSELNGLSSFADEIRNQIARAIREIAITCWNKYQEIDGALKLMDVAMRINVSQDVRLKFEEDKKALQKLDETHTCFFCGTNKTEKGCEIHKTLYLETSRSTFPRRVKYSYQPVAISRCRHCLKIHSKAWLRRTAIFVGVFILGIVIGFLSGGRHFITGGILGALVGWIALQIALYNQKSIIKIKDNSEKTLYSHPMIKGKFIAGWTFTRPMA